MNPSHAVVLGAGVSGLLAARVLADTFERVTLVEQDGFADPEEHGAGAAHSVHRSMLTPSTAAVMEELHPGLLAGLAAAGAPVLRDLRDMHLEVAGHRFCEDGGLPAVWHQPSRTLLEAHLRTRSAPQVAYRPGVVALDLVAPAGRVTGVGLLTASGLEPLEADLVVDATGGGLATNPDLTAPEETRLDVNVRQVTVTWTEPAAEEIVPLVVNEPHAGRPWGVAAATMEGGLRRLTALGYRGNHPPTDRAALLGFLEPLLPASWYRAVSSAAWPEPEVHDFPANAWRRWDKVAAPPDGLLVIGGGLCRLNPVHVNAGMTLATRQAALLRECLHEGLGDLPRRWYRASADSLTKQWAIARATDRLCVGASDPEKAAKVNRMIHKILTIAETDLEVAQNLLRVQWGLSEPTVLMNKALVRKLIVPRFPFGRGPRAASAPGH